MNEGTMNFITKLTPTWMIRSRMRFFGMQAMTKFEDAGGQHTEESKNLIYICRYWAETIIKRIPDDEEANAYRHFPEESFQTYIQSLSSKNKK
jgi:hypothetical protein